MRALSRTLLLCALPFLSVCAFPNAQAHAQASAATPSPDAVSKAQALFKKGSQLFGIKKYALALQDFRASYATVASPNSRLYIARCLAELGDRVEAYEEFTGVAEEAEQRAATEERYARTRDTALLEREEVAKKLGLVSVTVAHPESAAGLTIAGKEVAPARWGKPFPVAPGNAEVVLKSSAGAPVTQTLTLAAGEKKELTLDSVPSPSATGPTEGGGDGVELSTSTSPSRENLRPFAYVAGGVGVAGFAVFTVAGLLSNSTYSDLSESCNGRCPADRADDVSAGQTQQTIANVGLIVGAVGIATGATLFILSLSGSENRGSEVSRELVVGPGYAGVRGTF